MWSIIVRALFFITHWGDELLNVGIHGGTEIDITESPYMAALHITVPNDTHIRQCGGSIISASHILTAGHCVLLKTDDPNSRQLDIEDFLVLVGSSKYDNSDKRGEVHSVEKILFKEASHMNDIAILKLSENITLDDKTKKVIQLAEKSYIPPNDTHVHIDGWGENPENSINLHRAHIFTLYGGGCDLVGDHNHQICTWGVNSSGPCLGDSGGPLVTDDTNVQIGINSMSLHCPYDENELAIFTNVAENLDWIHSVLSNQEDTVTPEKTQTVV
ncbi:CLIP domain-containing serine protease B15 [Pseudolycoriella hygida]|uniref:CLIP domain-containing serine protease B15 n=1 Tax=Pseudolycoriella hygida TaxID=35572 RepID=A0A9Q0RVJ6_9DIPT|nr:CLIP domain-containing serine protease B15 [Pseudolycoriella hygida]